MGGDHAVGCVRVGLRCCLLCLMCGCQALVEWRSGPVTARHSWSGGAALWQPGTRGVEELCTCGGGCPPSGALAAAAAAGCGGGGGGGPLQLPAAVAAAAAAARGLGGLRRLGLAPGCGLRAAGGGLRAAGCLLRAARGGAGGGCSRLGVRRRLAAAAVAASGGLCGSGVPTCALAAVWACGRLRFRGCGWR